MTAKRGLFWYVDGELLCFPVSGEEADTVSNNHRRFWETLPHSLTGGMSYNYFPRGRVELRHGKAVVYLYPSLCTPGIDIRIRHAFSLPDEVPLSLVAVLPFPGYNADVTENSYRQTIAASDRILCVEPVRRMAALAARDRYMVDHSSRLIAVYDEHSRIHSGTWRALCYAREKQLDIRQIRWMEYL